MPSLVHTYGLFQLRSTDLKLHWTAGQRPWTDVPGSRASAEHLGFLGAAEFTLIRRPGGTRNSRPQFARPEDPGSSRGPTAGHAEGRPNVHRRVNGAAALSTATSSTIGPAVDRLASGLVDYTVTMVGLSVMMVLMLAARLLPKAGVMSPYRCVTTP